MRAIVLTAWLIFWPLPGGVAGALAIGMPDDVAEDGFALGASWNAKSPEQAERAAMALCFRTAGEQRKQYCEIGLSRCDLGL